jgi:hypothetical protein
VLPGAVMFRLADATGMAYNAKYLQEHVPAATIARRRGVVVTLAVAAALVAGPEAVTVFRAVVNVPISAVAVVWGRTHGGTCNVQGDLTVTCESMHSGYSNAGTTVGNVWLYGDLDGIDRHRHESRHSDQWAMFGPAFPAMYGAESIRTGGDYHRNAFERWAGLHDGGYLR